MLLCTSMLTTAKISMHKFINIVYFLTLNFVFLLLFTMFWVVFFFFCPFQLWICSSRIFTLLLIQSSWLLQIIFYSCWRTSRRHIQRWNFLLSQSEATLTCKKFSDLHIFSIDSPPSINLAYLIRSIISSVFGVRLAQAFHRKLMRHQADLWSGK